jgi:hypothetical protein
MVNKLHDTHLEAWSYSFIMFCGHIQAPAKLPNYVLCTSFFIHPVILESLFLCQASDSVPAEIILADPHFIKPDSFCHTFAARGTSKDVDNLWEKRLTGYPVGGKRQTLTLYIACS